MMTNGAPISANQTLALRIVDEVAPSNLREAALAMARRAIQAHRAGRPLPVTSARSIDVSGLAAGYFDDYRRRLAPPDKGGQAAHEVVRCVEAAAALAFDQSLAVERRVFETLRARHNRRRCATCFLPSVRRPGSPACRATRCCGRSGRWASSVPARWVAAWQ